MTLNFIFKQHPFFYKLLYIVTVRAVSVVALAGCLPWIFDLIWFHLNVIPMSSFFFFFFHRFKRRVTLIRLLRQLFLFDTLLRVNVHKSNWCSPSSCSSTSIHIIHRQSPCWTLTDECCSNKWRQQQQQCFLFDGSNFVFAQRSSYCYFYSAHRSL